MKAWSSDEGPVKTLARYFKIVKSRQVAAKFGIYKTMLNAYDRDTDLPVLPWNRTL